LYSSIPDAMARYRIAKALDLTMEWLVAGEAVILAKDAIQ